jgi:hypothetical protein
LRDEIQKINNQKKDLKQIKRVKRIRAAIKIKKK